MSFSIYHYAFFFLAFWVLRLLLRSILALRFHFRFGHIGFFSINDIQYHHHRSSETALWSVNVGKLKLRLKRRPTLASPTPFITIYIGDIHVKLHSLTALKKSAKRKQPRVDNQLNRRLSRVSSSLKKIPWWYSLSIVKHIIKFTSALPAQLLMAGLANYVDVQLDNLIVDVEDLASLKIQQVAFNSVLFADVTIPASPALGSLQQEQQPLDQCNHTGNVSSLHACYQRHSLKRAQHLFKEKFFEIMVKVDAISIESKNKVSMLTLPSGGQIAISCHLSAGCVTLKDIDVNTRIDTINVNANPLLELSDTIKRQNTKDQSYTNQLRKPSKNNMARLFRSLNFSIDTTVIETEHQEECSSTLTLPQFNLTALSESDVKGVDPYYKLQCSLGTIDWIVTNDEPIKMLAVPGIEMSAYIAQAMMNSESILDLNDITIPTKSFSDISLGPNKNFINVSIMVHEPKLYLDVAHASTLRKLRLQRRNTTQIKQDHQYSASKHTFYNWPRGSLSICVKTPSIEIKSSLPQYNGLISWAGATMEVSGVYCAQKNRPMSVLPRYSEPLTSTDKTAYQNDLQRIQSHTSKPSWTNLFRRSWKTKEENTPQKGSNIEWHYKTSFQFTVQSTCVDILGDQSKTDVPVDDSSKPTYFMSMDNLECSAHGRFDVCFDQEKIVILWDPDAHHISMEIELEKPVLNLWTTVKDQSQLEFWVTNVLNGFKANRPKAQKSGHSDDIYGYISILKTTVIITNAAIVLGGVDKGLKGKRAVPTGYLDNSPEKDIHIRLVTSIQETKFVFNGSRIFGATHSRHSLSNASSILSDNDHLDETLASSSTLEEKQLPFGTCRLSVQHIVVERIIKSDQDNHLAWHQYDDRKPVVLWISRINSRVEMVLEAIHQHIALVPSIVVKKSGIQYSITNHYACLVTAKSTKELIKQVFGKNKSDDMTPVDKSLEQKRVSFHQFQFQVNRCDVHIFLPGGEAELYLRLDSLRTQWSSLVEHRGEMPPTAIRNLTLFGIAPRQPGKWDQLLEMDSIRFSIEKDVDFATGLLTKTNQLAMSKFYARIPYGYELSSFVDSAVTLLKGIKVMHARLSKGVPFLYFGPQEKKTPALLPHMRLVCDLFTFQFEDDPFEARLRLIWKTGLVEQANRIAIQDAFEIKAQALMQQSEAEQKSSASEEESIYANEAADTRVNEAWQGLQEHKSKSWIRHIDASLSKERDTFDKAQSTDYRRAIFTEQLDEVDSNTDGKTEYLSTMFCIHTIDLPKYPPLLDLTIKHTVLDFTPPDFELDQTRQFIHDVGKGQPLDKPLSTLIPFHLNWKSGVTWAQLRDYPIPFVLVPAVDSNPVDTDFEANKAYAPATAAWSLSGNYVFADDMGDLDATRRIPISINDSYDIDIARTSTALKFFSTVNIDVLNSALSHICWSVPYQPAIQDIARVLDTFTKAPVDPSDKIGFWDKIRLIIHTRAKISFVGGGDLAIVIKGARDPYDMSEKGFGLAKVWRNNVVWLLGHENPESEFMQIISQDYAFGVPDLVRGGYTASYIIAAGHATRKDHQQMRHSASMSSFNSFTLSKGDENESRFVKIALKLSGGIRMGFGCQLERACNPNCEICDENSDVLPEAREVHKSRLLHFMPHYKVKLKTPQNVHEKNYDAYRGFRSDFIHVSISIIKLSSDESENCKGNVTGNSMHLTPGFIEHFVSWFRLFGGAMSYPLRAGSLFPKSDTRPSQKFGRHMSTMKYKVVINPLTVGYFIKDENVVAEEVTTEELGDSVGLKGFVKNFSVDIHQKREVVNVSNYKLDQKRLKANWPVTEAEVQLKNLDLRAVRATYTINGDESLSSSGAENVSVPVHMEYLSDQSDDGLNMMEGLNYQCNKDSDSSDWVDLDDFIERGVATPDILPAVQVLPFAFVPCIYYLRQSNRDDAQKSKHLRCTHDCILGTAVDTREMQMDLLRDRSKNIDVQIRKHQTRLHNIESKRLQHGEDEKSLEELSDTIVEKTRILYEKRELLQRYLKELSTQDMPDVVHNKTYASSSTIFGKDSLSQWEELMGYFKVRYIAHNPQILWNNSVRNILYHAMDLRDHRRALSYYMTSRTVKFLRDLIDASGLQYGPNHKQFVLDDDEGGMDTSMAEELIAKLLSEQDTKFYAPNETEEEKTQGGNDLDEVDMSRSENVNNPVMQLKTIPKNYIMKSSYLVDLLNPQISLQSDCDPDNIVLVANERTQVKGFNIIDETDPDVEMEMVKHRTVVSLDNVQFFVAKKEQFDSVDLLLDNHYGAKESDHWLAWIPPEMLISYVKRSDKFQRIGERIAATLQYDKYNPLRIKANANEFSEVHPFEDRCDSVQLNFPKLKLTADSSQYNAIYQVATDLLLYKEPAKKERLARLREIMMAADRASLHEATEKIVDLQNRARQLILARDQYRLNMALLDDERIEEFKSIRLTLYDTLEELYLGMEAIKLMQSNQRKDYHESKTNLKFVFCAEKVEWEMLSTGESPLCECTLTNFNFDFVSKEDHSSINTLEVDIVQVKNVSPSPVFVDVLGPYFDSRKPYDFSRHKMLRCYFVSLAPVGGIPVIQHLEINLHPMRVQMTYSFGKALAYYLFPPEKRQKQIESAAMTPSSSAPTATITHTSNIDTESTIDTQSLSNASTIALQQSSSERSDCNTIKPVSVGSVHQLTSAPPSLHAGLESQRLSANGTSNASLVVSPRGGDDLDQDTANDSPSSSVTLPISSSKKSKKHNIHKLSKAKATDDLSVMKKRASSNRAFILVKIPGARHCLSYQGPKEKNIEDLRDFAFEQPTLEFRNETWSWFELVSNVKKDFMRAALLHNSTALLKEKLLRRHPRENSKLLESSISVLSSPAFEGHHSNKAAYEADNNSESSPDDVDEDMLDTKDVASLHSAISQDIWDLDNLPESTPKRTHLWSKLTKPKKSSQISTEQKLPEHLHMVMDNDRHSKNTNADTSITATRSMPATARQMQDDDQLTVKGRHLLGKYYNGPTQWLVAGGSKFKGKQVLK